MTLSQILLGAGPSVFAFRGGLLRPNLRPGWHCPAAVLDDNPGRGPAGGARTGMLTIARRGRAVAWLIEGLI